MGGRAGVETSEKTTVEKCSKSDKNNKLAEQRNLIKPKNKNRDEKHSIAHQDQIA